MTEEKQVQISVDSVKPPGMLTISKVSQRPIRFAHDSASSRLSPRNTPVAGVLQKDGLGTLLFDLLRADEDEVCENRFDITLLTRALKAAIQWVKEQADTAKLKIGYFGASTGTAVALVAAADFDRDAKAIVSRGGRPDLAEDVLEKVIAPPPLVIGGDDHVDTGLNNTAYDRIREKSRSRCIGGE
jgi:putative phosphoribosyl transferase